MSLVEDEAPHVHLEVRVGAGEDLLATKAFLALSLTGGQYHHTTARHGLRPHWDESFDFCVNMPCRLIVTVHHPDDSTRAPGELCGQGVLVLRTLEEVHGDSFKQFWVPLKLTGRHAGKVCLEVMAVDIPCPNPGEPPEPPAPESSRRSFPTPRPPEVDGRGADDEHVRLLELHLEELLATEQDIKRTYDEEQAALLEELSELRAKVDRAWADPAELQARIAAREKHGHVVETLRKRSQQKHSKRHYEPLDGPSDRTRHRSSNATPRSASAPHRRSDTWDGRSLEANRSSHRGATPRSSHPATTPRSSQPPPAEAKGKSVGRSASAPRRPGEKSGSTRGSRPETPSSRGAAAERTSHRTADDDSVFSEDASTMSSYDGRGARRRGWDPEALVPEFVWHINDSGTPRRVRPEGTREMLYTAPYNELCDWGSPLGARHY